jgi:hypothetical protein
VGLLAHKHPRVSLLRNYYASTNPKAIEARGILQAGKMKEHTGVGERVDKRPVLFQKSNLVLQGLLKNGVALLCHSSTCLAHKLSYMTDEAQMLASSAYTLDGTVCGSTCSQEVRHWRVDVVPLAVTARLCKYSAILANPAAAPLCTLV